MQTSASNLIDSGTYNVAYESAFTASTIETFTVSTSTVTPGQTATYTFTLKPRSKVITGSYIKIAYPSSIAIDEYNLEATPVSGFTNTRLTGRTRSNYILDVTKGFQNSDSVSDPPTLTFTVFGFINNRLP